MRVVRLQICGVVRDTEMTEERELHLSQRSMLLAVFFFSENLTNWAVISLLISLLGSSGNSLKQKRNETVDRTLQVWLRHVASTARSRVTFEKTQRKKNREKQHETDEKDHVVSCHCEKRITPERVATGGFHVCGSFANRRGRKDNVSEL